jgi:hypothetical protein
VFLVWSFDYLARTQARDMSVVRTSDGFGLLRLGIPAR